MSDKFVAPMSPIVTKLIQEARNESPELATKLPGPCAWNESTRGFIADLVSEEMMERIDEATLPEARQILGEDLLSAKDLVDQVPCFEVGERFGGPSKRVMAIYMIVGNHINGDYALYIGVTEGLYRRPRDHTKGIEHYRQGTPIKSSGSQKHHKVLAQPGWTHSYRVLATFQPHVATKYAYAMETLFMLLLCTCSLEPNLGNISNIASRALIRRLEPEP